MSPFREAPQIELGPLDVGLEIAVKRASARLPRGGRLVMAPPRDLGPDDRRGPHPAGALGSAGLVIVCGIALVAWVMGWQPASVTDVAEAVPVVVFAGVSLAAVLRAADRTARVRIQRAEVVARSVRRVLRRLTRLEQQARRGHVDPGRASALRNALAAAGDPEIAPWIPADVRGRAELLLARVLLTSTRPSRLAQSMALHEARGLLLRAAGSLEDAAPACADLAAITRAPGRRARIATPADEWAAVDEAESTMGLRPADPDSAPCPDGQIAARSEGLRAGRW